MSVQPEAGPVLDLVTEAAPWQGVPGLDALVRSAVAAALSAGGFSARADAELAVVLADDGRVRALNRQWRGLDKPTNVLSFPASPHPASAPVIGDLILAYETVAREAELENKPLAHHLQHLVVHGTLHLFGLDHETDHDAERMEAVERRALAELGVPDPYQETLPAHSAG